MSLYNKASLVMIPSGYKSGKVYSQKPTDGNGDLTFTRASSATRVNSDGLIEKVRTNLLTYSEQFDNNYYGKVLGTVTANAGIAPDGTLTADLFTKTSGVNTVSEVRRSGTYAITGAHSFSVYFKQSVGDKVLFRMDLGGNTANIEFVFSTKVSTPIGANILSHSIEELANGWFRLKMSANVISTNWLVSICNLFSNPTNDAVLIWGAQLEEGVSATEYIPTTTSIRTKFAGITQDGASAANVPRLDYSQGSCPSLLLEPQRTNLALYSEEFDVGWIRTTVSITSNTTISPDGNLSADTLSIGVDTVSGRHRLLQTKTLVSGSTYTGTYYLKANAHQWIQIIGNIGFSTGVWANFDLVNGAIGNTGGTDTTASIENVGNGWYRCRVSGVATGTSTTGFEILVINNTNGGRYPSYQSLAAEDVCYIWGAQLEVGAYPTSYIPTLGTSVTRVIDRSTLSVADTTNKTYFLDAKRLADDKVSNSANFFGLGALNITFWNSNRLRFRFGGAINQYYSLTGDDFKIAVSYNGTNSKVFVNGSLIFTQAYTLINSTLSLNGNESVAFNEVLLFPINLTDAQCIELTTI